MKYTRPRRAYDSLCPSAPNGKHLWDLRMDLEQPTPETADDALTLARAHGQKRAGYVCRRCGCEEAT